MSERTFPVLWQVYGEERERYKALGCPKRVPWSLVETHESQAYRNHGQTLTRLAQRGGLSPAELVAVLEGKPIRWVMSAEVTDLNQIPRLLELVAAHAEALEKAT